MKSLALQVEAYLELRHKLGFDLRLVGGLLHRFVLFAQKKKTSVITTKLALDGSENLIRGHCARDILQDAEDAEIEEGFGRDFGFQFGVHRWKKQEIEVS
jgi:hypothetical protein